MAEIFSVVQPVPHEKLGGCIISHPAGIRVERRESLVQERTHVQAPRLPLLKDRNQTPQSPLETVPDP